MKTLYPQPYLRMMSDIDFIIDTENLQAGEKLLQRMGYRTEVAPNGLEVNGYGKTGLAVELHTDFFAPGNLCYSSITDPFGYKASFDTIFYLYNLLHTLKHFLQNGAGIRRIMDLYMLQSQVWEKVDQEHVKQVLSESGFEATAQTLLELAKAWFAGEKPQADLRQVEEMVFLSGNHGSYQVSLVNEYRSTNGGPFFKLRRYLSLLFPSKANVYKGYPYCREKKLPLLFCWVYRWVFLLRNKRRRKSGFAMLRDIGKAKLK